MNFTHIFSGQIPGCWPKKLGGINLVGEVRPLGGVLFGGRVYMHKTNSKKKCVGNKKRNTIKYKSCKKCMESVNMRKNSKDVLPLREPFWKKKQINQESGLRSRYVAPRVIQLKHFGFTNPLALMNKMNFCLKKRSTQSQMPFTNYDWRYF